MKCALLALAAGVLFAAEPEAADIMKRVAENQDREQRERGRYIYEENIRVTTRRSNGKLAREEVADLLVTPTPTGTEKKRQSIRGRYWHKGRYLDFSGDPVPDRDTLDGGLTSGFRDDLTNSESKDGIGKSLFPLTTDEQKDLRFELAAKQAVAGRDAYRIRFGPRDAKEFGWTGEALIDVEELQPLSVYTRLSRRIPFFIRTLFGTDVPGLGFSVKYARIDKDVWFPVSFGTEFRLHAVFFINRTITVSMENKNFRRATAESSVNYQ